MPKMTSFINMIKDIIRRQFLSGMLVVVPLILTYVVFRFLFTSIDGILSPYLQKFLGYSIPGLGIAFTIIVIILTGFFTRSIIGGSIYKKGDQLLAKVPVIRVVYLAAKRLIEAISLPHSHTFKQVVMFEYPRRGAYVMGFATTRLKFEREVYDTCEMVGVFVPSTPTPFSGIVIFVPKEDVTPLDISVEEGLKLIVSGGIVSPPTIRRREGFYYEEAELSDAPGQSA